MAPSRLVTTAIRGASTTQTAILWNGFNLNSPMLGQADLSLIPAFFIDNISLQYGSNSAAWGSGAIGGAILLQNKERFEQHWQGDWHSSIGSFGNYFNGTSFHFSNEKFYSESKTFYQTGKNNFPIDGGLLDKLHHAQVKKWGILQKNGFKIKDKQQLDIQLWYQNADRELPPTLTQTNSIAEQQDESFRSGINWKRTANQSIIQARSGVFYERLGFQDAIARIASKSKAWTWSNEIEWTKTFNFSHSLNLGGNYTFLKAQSTGYGNKNPQQNRSAIFVTYHFSPSQKWKMQCAFRQDWVDARRTPFIPAFGFEGKLWKSLSIRGTISKSYRIPTFNDLFWQLGGNENLLPEAGWNQEIGLGYALNEHWKIATTAYNRNIDNWIIWLPNGGIWSPENLQKVWSRGLESQLQWKKKWGAIHLDFLLNYDLTYSTNQRAANSSDRSAGKQLIYVPKHKINISASLKWQDWNILYYHHYTGEVFTLSDHSDALSAYHLDHIYFYKKLKINKIAGNIFFKINNVFAKNYQVVANYPMPKRNWEVGWKVGNLSY